MTSGDVEMFLGIKVEQLDGTLVLSQKLYTRTILERFGMESAHPVSSPCDNSKVNYNYSLDERLTYPYRKLVGCLLYLSLGTRPDISYGVGVASRKLNLNTSYSTRH